MNYKARIKISFFVNLYIFFTPVYAYDLFSIYTMAKEEDPLIRAAEHEYQAEKQKVPLARAHLLPEIMGQTIVTNNNSTAFNVGHYKYSSFALDLNQPLINFQYWGELVKSNFEVAQAVAVYCAAEQALMVRVAEAYFGVLKAQDNLYFSRHKRKAIEKFLEQSEERLKVKLISITDVKLDRAKYDIAVSEEISSENELLKKKEKLREIIGAPVPLLSILKESSSLPAPEPMNIDDWVSSAQTKNFELQAYMFKSRAAFQDIRISSAGHFPILDFTGHIDRSSGIPPTQASTLISTNSSTGIKLSMPLFKGGEVNAKIKQASETYQKVDSELEAKEREVESKARQFFHGVLTDLSQVQALKEAVSSNKSALEATKVAFDVGLRTSVDVLNAHSDYIKVQREYVDARYNYVLDSLRLKQAAGILSCKDIELVNKWLVDPKES